MDSAERNSINRFLITIKDNKIIEARHVTEDKRSIIKARYQSQSDKNSLSRMSKEIRWNFPWKLTGGSYGV
jgi:hypothetical protein